MYYTAHVYSTVYTRIIHFRGCITGCIIHVYTAQDPACGIPRTLSAQTRMRRLCTVPRPHACVCARSGRLAHDRLPPRSPVLPLAPQHPCSGDAGHKRATEPGHRALECVPARPRRSACRRRGPVRGRRNERRRAQEGHDDRGGRGQRGRGPRRRRTGRRRTRRRQLRRTRRQRA